MLKFTNGWMKMAIPISPNVNQLQNTGSCKKCDLENADLSSANLSGATLHGAEVSGASFSGATFCNTITSDGETDSSGC